MNVNGRRGEVAAVLDGKSYRLCLTLGALAELEDAFAAEDISALVARFSGGKLTSRDLIRIIAAGLRGGGTPISDDELAAMTCEGGANGFAGIASDLLQATFGGTTAGEPAEETPQNP